ncbi:MAG: hypothetical protein JXM70_01460, partial [Pirellulales bacterium]|nr:hypothetical protein [Pirellulales bacterium]
EKLLKNLFDLRNAFYDYSLDGGQGIVDLRINPGDIEVDRFGLNYELIEELGLSWIDNLKSGNDKQPPLNNPRHPDFKKPYVQEYIRDYCDGYLNRSGFYTTNTPRKCEANALIANIEEGRRLCEQAILKYLDDSVVAEHEAELIERRHELRAITGDWFPGNGDHKPSRRRPRRRKGE